MRGVVSKILKSRVLSISIATVLTLAIGVLDYFTGRECQVVALYLVPVSLVVWSAGRRWGIACSLLSASTWLVAEVSSGDFYAFRSSPFWNALMFLTVFLLVALLLSALHDMVNSLERRVRIRTGQLREEMTKRHDAELARLRAERLALVGTMAAQVAHEVRNPLGSISLNLDLLSCELGEFRQNGDHAPDEAALLLGQIRQEIARVEHVMRDYLGFARLPKVVPQLRPLHDFLDEKLAMILPELGAARVRLVKEYDPDIRNASIDPVQMWQVILNLLLNARDAMPEGGELRVATHLRDGCLEISVSDTGSGIRNEDMTSLFTPFFTTKAKGTGLGLALSQQIVTEHGGQMTCRSAVGIGTTFTIALPYPAENSGRLPTPRADTLSLNPHEPHELLTSYSY